MHKPFSFKYFLKYAFVKKIPTNYSVCFWHCMDEFVKMFYSFINLFWSYFSFFIFIFSIFQFFNISKKKNLILYLKLFFLIFQNYLKKIFHSYQLRLRIASPLGIGPFDRWTPCPLLRPGSSEGPARLRRKPEPCPKSASPACQSSWQAGYLRKEKRYRKFSEI